MILFNSTLTIRRCENQHQRCANPEIFESASVRRFWPRIRCQSASASERNIGSTFVHVRTNHE